MGWDSSSDYYLRRRRHVSSIGDGGGAEGRAAPCWLCVHVRSDACLLARACVFVSICRDKSVLA